MKSLFTLTFIFFIVSLHSQDVDNGIKLVNNISGAEIGYSYPFRTRGYGYQIVESHFNFGFTLGYEWGRRYRSGNSLMLVPSFVANSISTTKYLKERRNEINNKLEYQNTISIQSKNLSLIIPGLFEIPFLQRFRIAAGPYFMFQMAGWESIDKYTYSLHNLPRSEKYSYQEELETYLGFIAKFTVPLRAKENNEHLISIQYIHTIEGNQSSGDFEKRFTLSFTKRNLIQKEKREKWDRYLTRKKFDL